MSKIRAAGAVSFDWRLAIEDSRSGPFPKAQRGEIERLGRRAASENDRIHPSPGAARHPLPQGERAEVFEPTLPYPFPGEGQGVRGAPKGSAARGRRYREGLRRFREPRS